MEAIKKKDLHRLYGGYEVDEEQVNDIWDLIKGCIDASDAESVLESIDTILGFHGVESLPKLLYCNEGDSYAPTVVYFLESETFAVMAWADAVEELKTASIESHLEDDDDDEDPLHGEDTFDDYDTQYDRGAAPYER